MRRKKSYIFALILLLGMAGQAQAQNNFLTNNEEGSTDHLSGYDIYNAKQAVVISDTLKGWNANWVANLNGSQASYNNWSQGGVNTISVTAATIFNELYRKGDYGYGLVVSLRYGKTRIAGEGTRKTDDRIAINNKFSRQFTNENWNAFATINFSTQFDQGFDYDVDDGEDPILISEFFAPAYLSETVGIGFTPNEHFTAEGGLATKTTFVSNDSLSTEYGLNKGDNLRFEPGFSVTIGYKREILKNVQLQSSLGSFTNLQRSFDRTDVTFSTEIIGKINDYLNMSFQFESVYDDDFSKDLQLKQVLSAGVSVSLI